MDLGFGSANQSIGNAAAAAILHSTQAREEAIDDELQKYDDLLKSTSSSRQDNDASGGGDKALLDDFRTKRRAQIIAQKKQRDHWVQNLGHGTYTELGGEGQMGAADVAKDFFEISKNSERLVLHFYRPTTRYCDIVHAHIQGIATKHVETRFVKVNVENVEAQGVAYLVDKLNIVVMPTLVVVKNRKVCHQVRGFDELGGSDDFSSLALAHVLGRHGAINPTEEEMEVPEELDGRSGVNAIRLKR